MIKNKAMLFIAAVLSVGVASTVALPAVSHNKNIVLQANRTIKKNSVTVSSYSLNNKTIKGTFTITKSVNLNNPNNGISIGTNPDNPALMNQEFNGQIKNQNGKVYNLYTFTGVLPAGTYTYTLSNVPANAEYVTFELASDNGNLTSYQVILPYQYLTNINVQSYDYVKGSAKLSFNLTSPLNLANQNNSILFGTNLNNPGLMCKQFNEVIVYQNGTKYNMNKYTGVLPAGKYTATITNIPLSANSIKAEIMDNGAFFDYNCNLTKPLIDNLKTSNYDANKGTADLEFNLISSLNLSNENNSILFGTDLNNPGLMCKQFNEVIVYQNGTEYNMNKYTGVLPAGKYTAKLTNIPSNSKLIKVETMDNGTFLDYNTSL